MTEHESLPAGTPVLAAISHLNLRTKPCCRGLNQVVFRRRLRHFLSEDGRTPESFLRRRLEPGLGEAEGHLNSRGKAWNHSVESASLDTPVCSGEEATVVGK